MSTISKNRQLNPNIKNWQDIAEYYPEEAKGIMELQCEVACTIGVNEKIAAKIIATAKIAKIIEFGYGNMLTIKEWENEQLVKYNIENISGTIAYNDVTDNYSFISFHTDEQRDEFMSYPENVNLVKQYFMM